MSVKRFSIAFIIIAIVILGFFTVNASTNSEIIDNYEEEIKIREVILDYFDRRYDSRMNNQLANFSELTDGSPQADDFLKSESDKLEIEIYNAKTHHLRYIQYKYILDFKEVSIDEENNSAIVALTEGHNVVFEISKMIDKKEPVISKMRNLAHTIILNKTQGRWKIISDNYDDQLWRMIRASNLSKEEIFTMIDAEQAQPSDIENVESTTFSCNLQSDESTHPYTRNGAIAYAHQYALYPNPEYYYFPDNDCTNFVNQAIYHGSNGEKVGSNTYGWYYNYYNNVYDNDYSASWTHVQFLYDFITQYLVWNKGPEGCEINNNYDALEGDLVQFEWKDDNDTDWDHTVIIVRKMGDPDDPSFYVAGHSDDYDYYPLSSIIYQSRRFIHIERIDGYGKVYIPLGLKDTSDYSMDIIIDPYPAPMDDVEDPVLILPYPAP